MRFAHAGRFLSGIVAPLSALRTSGSPGCGEFPDLLALGKLAESWGFNLLQLLPVNDTGTDSSPYSACSAFALHPLYLRIGELPELAVAEGSTSSPLPSTETYRAEEQSLVDRFG
ncbi:MAG TPA: 4-alpha-glucanotransferase, partial [Spirochaetia bacterium]|nr:4-alpha-glucanotransferase [Spirochaetia bacterium]